MNAKDIMLARKLGGGGGGGAITDGIVVNERTTDNLPLDVVFNMDSIPPYMCRSYYHNGFYDGAWYKCKNFELKGTTTIYEYAFSTMIALESVIANDVVMVAEQAFSGDVLLTEINLPNCEEFNITGKTAIDNSNYVGCEFSGCTSLVSANLPKLKNLNRDSFGGCTALKTVYVPNCAHLISRTTGLCTFRNCTALETIQIGSVGVAVQSLSSLTFTGCTQSTLTVTCYTTVALKDTILANIRNGATNATIIIKDSDTGEVLITSTP